MGNKIKLIYKKMSMASSQKVRLSDYELMTTVGTGSFGRVRIAKNKQTNT